MARDRGTTSVIVVAQQLLMEVLGEALAARPGIDVVGVESTVDGARAAAAAFAPDVALVDALDGPGLLAVAAVAEVSPRTRSVVIMDHVDPARLAYCLASGCAGLVGRSQTFDEIVDALATAADGGIVISSRLVDVARRLRVPDVPREPLTDREHEVLALLAEGRSTSEIVDELVVSVHTVRNHIRSILLKLGAHSRLEAVALATRLGELPTGQRAGT